MVDEVVSHQCVEAVVVASRWRRRDRHELAIAGRRRPGAGPVEQGRGPVATVGPVVPAVAGGRIEQERGRHQKGRRGLVLGPPQHLGGDARVTADQPAEEAVIGHEVTIAANADDALMGG